MASQRFCLRWNNHQSNLLSVFDQLLHDESFVDVTLAVEGRFLRAHKMVLSACSPYFQALFVGHPDKHPIVILKDVPYSDMRSLLDFMYRGEVSVDQDRLTAFLKVAESLRIKGLTEVNEEKCDLPSITSSLLSSSPMSHTPPPPPHLHRIHPANLHHRRGAASGVGPSTMPLLGSALTAPKRKRGRPRKLSGSSNVGEGDGGGGDRQGADGGGGGGLLPNSEEMCEQKMTESNVVGGGGQRGTAGETENGTAEKALANEVGNVKENHTAKRIKVEPEPTPGTSTQAARGQGPGSRPEQPSEAFLVKTERAESEDSESLPEDENDLITLSPSSSRSSLSAPDRSDPDRSNPGRSDPGRSDPDRSNPDRSNPDPEDTNDPDRRRHHDDDDVSDEIFRSFDALTFAAGGDPDLSTDDPDRSGRKFCVREGDNVFRCVLCRKTYTHISNFCRHYMTTHTNRKQLAPCPLCKKPFTRRDNMLVHMKTVHRYDMGANNVPVPE